MPVLEVLHFTGDVTRHELSKGQPLTIGSHSTNDIVIDDESVELMHCRVSWSKSGFEAVAAGIDGLDLNGTVVQRAILKSGDTLRFGSVDIRFADDGESTGTVEKRTGKEQSAVSPPAAQKPRKPAPSVPDDDETQSDSSGGGWNALEALAAEARAPEKPKKRGVPSAVEPDTLEEIQEAEAIPQARSVEVTEDAGSDEPKLTDKLRTAMRSQRYRPGQEDSLRSPLILGLGGTAAVLLLLGGIFFFIASRQDAQAEFDAAKSQFDQAKYAQANEMLLNFVTTYSGHSLEDEARRIMGLSQIDANIRGAAKKWPEGLEALRAFIDNRQELEEFDADQEDIHTRAYEIALGATQDAAKLHNRELIQTGQEAVTILKRFLPEDAQAAIVQEIDNAKRISEAEILKHETLTNALAEIDRYVPGPPAEGETPPEGEAVNPTPIPALVVRRNLLASYPDLVNHRDVVAAMARILEAERSLVTYTEINTDALTDDPQATAPAALSLVFNARSRLDAVSVGQCAYALSKDAIFGIDTITGAPVWRRIVGFDLRFYPVEEPTIPSLIVFDTNRLELCRIHRNTGEMLWRQPITADDVRSAPIVHEGQILLPTMGGSIYQIDLQSGRLIGKLSFSQEVTTPVPLADGKLVVAGNEEVAYTLTGRPFECVGVSYLGQQPGSMTAPLLSMGPYVAMIEGVSADKSLLRLIDASGNDLREVARADILGEVYDTPVIRGRDLFVPSTGERVTAFSISDDTNQPPLTVGPTFQVQNGGDNPVFLMTGPDRQLWMTSSALLKLQLTSESLASESGELTIGEASQPLQYQSGMIFNGRRRSYSTAVTLTPIDRDEQTSEWQAQVGASLLAVSPADGSLICLTEEGGVFRLTDMGWTSSVFGPEPSTRLPLNPELAEPLLATSLGNGQIAVACGDPEPKLWIINVRGEIERSTLLESPLQAAPIMLGEGIVLPMQGRLKYQPIRAGGAGVQDYTLPTDEALSSRWLQVVRLSDTNIAALTSAGNVLLIALQSSPRAHLGEVSRFSLPAAVGLPLQGDSQFLAVADVNHNVQVFDTATLSPVAQRSFETGVQGVWSSAGQVFVQTTDGMLNLVSGSELSTSLQVQLQSVLIGPPTITGNSALVALQNGQVFNWDLTSGEVRDFRWIGAALSQLPIPIGNELLFVTVDGSLIRLPSDSQVAAGAQTAN